MNARRRTTKRRVLVVTGSRAEFGLLRPVMEAVKKHTRLELLVAVAGEHLLRPALTWREVAADYRIDAKVPMQRQRDRGRVDHAAACGRGVAGFAAAYRRLRPDWVVVLGDRIEAFAAASAASIAGIAVCHVHGGDRAEGIADEAMRHAITKLAHLHCAATKLSAERIRKLGERRSHVFVTGSPAIDELRVVRPMGDPEYAALGEPGGVVLLHPWGATRSVVAKVVDEVCVLSCIFLSTNEDPAVLPVDGLALWLMPNHDPGRKNIIDAIRKNRAFVCDHLPRHTLLSLFKRLAATRRGLLIGNSSAGLIECAVIGLPAVNIGERQAGRERAGNVVDVKLPKDMGDLRSALATGIELAQGLRRSRSTLFGDGRAGPRIASLLAKVDPQDPALLRKRNSY